ncbi:MAG: hypothetical protein LBD11_04230 [Candidatus Peribacteria bacterium]|jgi:hypothetical protein|nr:hypothetical protein [Candidatus Peribacteria bacterium]
MKKSEIIEELRSRKENGIIIWVIFFNLFLTFYFVGIKNIERLLDVLEELDLSLSLLLFFSTLVLFSVVIVLGSQKLIQLLLRCWTPTTKQIVKYDNEIRAAVERDIAASKQEIMKLEKRIGELKENIECSEERLANWKLD